VLIYGPQSVLATATRRYDGKTARSRLFGPSGYLATPRGERPQLAPSPSQSLSPAIDNNNSNDNNKLTTITDDNAASRKTLKSGNTNSGRAYNASSNDYR